MESLSFRVNCIVRGDSMVDAQDIYLVLDILHKVRSELNRLETTLTELIGKV